MGVVTPKIEVRELKLTLVKNSSTPSQSSKPVFDVKQTAQQSGANSYATKPRTLTNTQVSCNSENVSKQALDVYIANIHATYNNTIISISNIRNGNVISIASGGSAGFKGSRRNSAYAAQCAAELVVRRFTHYLMNKSVGTNAVGNAIVGTGLPSHTSTSASQSTKSQVGKQAGKFSSSKLPNKQAAISAGTTTPAIQLIAMANGFGKGREAALRGLASQGIKITKILDVTPIAHNGCKPPKMRRL